jgi:citrate lyase subunit gamma (acyl carrier protein)
MIKVSAGTLESNDIWITLEVLENGDDITIELESIVMAQFGDSIREALLNLVQTRAKSCGLLIKAIDKGALPYTIEARMVTALSRADLLKGEK